MITAKTKKAKGNQMPVTFTPTSEGIQAAPYFEDVSEKKGFRGHGTHKGENILIAEITSAVSNLGGLVVDVRQGKFTDDIGKSRYGYKFVFSMPGPGGQGRAMAEIQIAALPLRNWTQAKEAQSKKMALYVLRDWLETAFNFQQCTPTNTAILIPFMLNANGETLSSSYLSGSITNLLPASTSKEDEEVIEGSYA